MSLEIARGSKGNGDSGDEPWSSIQLPVEKRNRLRDIRDSNDFSSYHELIDELIQNSRSEISQE